METEIDAGKILNIIVVLVGSMTALIAGLVTAHKTVRETNARVKAEAKAAELAEKELDLKALGVKADVSTKIQEIYGRMTEDFNKKLADIREEMREQDLKYQQEIVALKEQLEKDKLIQQELMIELESSKKEGRVRIEAGIMLIRAIEQSLELRKEASMELNNCKACTISDRALMKTLSEVKVLFKNGN